MAQKTNQQRIERRIWVPHNGGETAFALPAVETNYEDAGRQILKSGLQIPTGEQIASLLYAAFCNQNTRDNPEFQEVRNIMMDGKIWVFNKNLWTPEGVYVVHDSNLTGMSEKLIISELEKALKDGKEFSWGGIRMSNDGRVRFAPKGTYNRNAVRGWDPVIHTPGEFARDGFSILTFGEEGAWKLAEVAASTFKSQSNCKEPLGIETHGDHGDRWRMGGTYQGISLISGHGYSGPGFHLHGRVNSPNFQSSESHFERYDNKGYYAFGIGGQRK